MRKYFGTDGIRGEFGKQLTIGLTLDVAVAASEVLKKHNEEVCVCIARDPRSSSKSIENALVAGLTANGVNVELFGVTTTPVISYMITNSKKYNAGIMISASHNPACDNGIKFFGNDGKKLSDELENEIELLLNSDIESETAQLGHIYVEKNANDKYVEFLKKQVNNFVGLKIGLDTANGSSVYAAKKIFSELGAEVLCIGDKPNGENINDGVGSTHPERLSELVVSNKLDFGIAFDGDGDRLMLVNADGTVLDGDYMIYLLAKKLKNENKLLNNTVVSTVMANLGFNKAMSDLNINVISAAVGDRFVMQQMSLHNAIVGGEQSGHIILSDILPTGDGILCAVILTQIFKDDLTKLTNLQNELIKYPQSLVNFKVLNKDEIMNSIELSNLIKQQENTLKGNGRILVRASGTESLIRVMVEASTLELCNEIIKPFINMLEDK